MPSRGRAAPPARSGWWRARSKGRASPSSRTGRAGTASRSRRATSSSARWRSWGTRPYACAWSHAGVSIGEDGPSQMALDDLAMMRALVSATVLYPSDAVSAERIVEAAARTPGLVYIRTSRPKTPVLYGNDEAFPVGGSKTLRQSARDAVTVVAAGITVFEALSAHETLQKEGVAVRVIDLYSVQPLDADALRQAAAQTR